MTVERKTLSSFWGQPCHHFGDGLGCACHHFGDGLSSFWGRFGRSDGLPCHHFGDILNNHTSKPIPCIFGAKQAGRPVDTKDRTDGLPACLRLSPRAEMVPMPLFLSGPVTGGMTFLLTHTGGLADG